MGKRGYGENWAYRYQKNHAPAVMHTIFGTRNVYSPTTWFFLSKNYTLILHHTIFAKKIFTVTVQHYLYCIIKHAFSTVTVQHYLYCILKHALSIREGLINYVLYNKMWYSPIYSTLSVHHYFVLYNKTCVVNQRRADLALVSLRTLW